MKDIKTYKNFVYEFNEKLSLKLFNTEYSNIIFLCIGTDKVIGDSFGPLVGETLKKLLKKSSKKTCILGDLTETISFRNLNQKIEYINKSFSMPFIIAIDSAVSAHKSIGTIKVSQKGLLAGSGLNKKSSYVGNMSIKAVVATDTQKPKNNFIQLQKTSSKDLLQMVNIVSLGISEVIN